MEQTTIRQLSSLNQRFYNDQATTWSASRQYFWPSWETFRKQSSLTHFPDISVLDLGCGTGRFARFVQQHWTQAHYLGMDNSTALLEQASSQPSELPEEKYVNKDLVAQLLDHQSLIDKKYDLITAFGVLHHLPSQQLRRQFLLEIADRMNPNGECWLTLWLPEQLGYKKPQEKPWPEISEQLGIDPQDREPGDVLLGWKDSEAVRYVHWLQAVEQTDLQTQGGLTIVEQWPEMSQGERGNLCWLLRHQAAPL